MKKNDLIVLGILAAVLVAGIVMLLTQRRVPPGVGEQHVTPSEAGYYGRADRATDRAEPVSVVYWISIDGLRSDYLERADTPFFDFLLAEGAYSLEHEVVFPSTTFPSHVSQATGVRPGEHGITANSFHDLETGREYHFPSDSSLLEAEPIWNTAVRQGLRVASLDWVLSHAQTGPYSADYFDPEYQRGLSNEERLRRLLDILLTDEHSEPLRLLMGYTVGPDSPGHRFGPDSDEVVSAVEEIDAILGRHYEELVEFWNENMAPDDELYFTVTSDHGMSEVHTLVHPDHLTGLSDREDVRLITSANIAHVYLDSELSPGQRDELVEETLDRLAEFGFVRAYTRESLPAEWGYDHPSRTGDLLIVLESGYTFSRRPHGIRMAPEEGTGPFGMHGYDPVQDPDMNTVALFHRYPISFGGTDLGPVHSLQLHPTVARLLGITPAETAQSRPIDLR